MVFGKLSYWEGLFSGAMLVWVPYPKSHRRINHCNANHLSKVQLFGLIDRIYRETRNKPHPVSPTKFHSGRFFILLILCRQNDQINLAPNKIIYLDPRKVIKKITILGGSKTIEMYDSFEGFPLIVVHEVWVGKKKMTTVQIEPSFDDLILTKKAPKRWWKSIPYTVYPTSCPLQNQKGWHFCGPTFLFHYSLFGSSPKLRNLCFFMPAVSIPVVFCVLGGALSSTQRPLIPEAFASSAMPWTDKAKQRTIWGVTKVRGILLEVWDAHHFCETCLLFFLLDLLKMLGKSKVFC